MPSPSLTTCCAHCRTVFRVTTVQLQAHAGQVRCGRCMQVFNALAALAPESAPVDIEHKSEQKPEGTVPALASVPAETAVVETPQVVAPDLPEPEALPPAAEIAVQAGSPGPETQVPEAVPDTAVDDAVVIAKNEGIDRAIVADQSDAVIAAEPAPQEAAADTETPPQTDAVTVTAADADNPFVDAPPVEKPADPRRRRFAVASALMATLLALQGVFFYRGEVAARYPPAREWLGSLCAQAGCTVTLPQRPQSILIEASDLQVTDPANPNRIQLTATLRNHAGYDVAYPALDLVLTNVNDHTLARRIFLPEDYLGAGRDLRTGIAANAEMTVRLALETGNLGAAGFRLAVLSAPVR